MHWGQAAQLRNCSSWKVQPPDRKLVANAGLARQTTEGGEKAHPSERHVRHSACPLTINYIAETLWGRRGRPKQKPRQNTSSSWRTSAPETPRHVRHEPKNCASLWRDLIPPCQAKARRQKKHSKARKESRARLRESTRPEASCMSDALFLWLVQRLDVACISHVQSVPNSCEAFFCFEGQKEERVGAGARSAVEACGLRQEKSRTRWIQRSAQGHEHSAKSDDSRNSAVV